MARGTYVLFLRPADRGVVPVGGLGELELEPGVYAYVGSAFGPGGLGARLRRHLRGEGAVHWHVDYLRRRAVPVQAWLTRDPSRREHEWAASLSGLPGSTAPMPGFGASDCGCRAHLFHFGELPSLERFRRRTAAGMSGRRAPVHRLHREPRGAG